MRGMWLGSLAVAALGAGMAAAQIEDGGKLFAKSPEALKEAEAIFARLAKDLDVHPHVVTLPPLPKGRADEIAKMDAAGKAAFWKTQVDGAFNKLKNGERSALLLISQSPGRVQLRLGKQTAVSQDRQKKLEADVLGVLKKDSNNFGGALLAFAKDFEKDVVEAKQAGVLKKTVPGAAAAKPGVAGARAPGEFNPMNFVWIGLAVLVGFMLLRGIFGGMRSAQANRQQYPQGMGGGYPPPPGPGGYQRPMGGPGYPQQTGYPQQQPMGYPPQQPAGGGGMFMKGMLGGIVGAAAGSWIYDRMSGGGMAHGGSHPDAGGTGAGAGGNEGGDYSGGGDFGNAEDEERRRNEYNNSGNDYAGGGGGDFGGDAGGDYSGGGDFGGGDGGGDY